MRIIEKQKSNGSTKHIDVVLSTGMKFRISEDVEGMLEITKVEDESRLCVNPRYSNQICVK